MSGSCASSDVHELSTRLSKLRRSPPPPLDNEVLQVHAKVNITEGGALRFKPGQKSFTINSPIWPYTETYFSDPPGMPGQWVDLLHGIPMKTVEKRLQQSAVKRAIVTQLRKILKTSQSLDGNFDINYVLTSGSRDRLVLHGKYYISGLARADSVEGDDEGDDEDESTKPDAIGIDTNAHDSLEHISQMLSDECECLGHGAYADGDFENSQLHSCYDLFEKYKDHMPSTQTMATWTDKNNMKAKTQCCARANTTMGLEGYKDCN